MNMERIFNSFNQFYLKGLQVKYDALNGTCP